jgi:hypothetical protein
MMELLSALEASAFSTFLRESTSVWAYPTVLMLHTVGLALLVGLNAAFDLRLLGVGRGIPLEALETWFPVMWIGFWLNTVTGVMLFATDPIRLGATMTFLSKLAIVFAGVVLIARLRRTVYGRRTEASPAVTVTSKARAYAVLSLLIWAAAIVTGRLMAYVSEL